MAFINKFIFFCLTLLFNSCYAYPNDGLKLEKNDSDIDTIQSIEALSNQIIINTSKVGPIDILKVIIDVYDLESKKLLFSNSYSGILLLISRGRYVINFLKPYHWYGIVYQVFQTSTQESKYHIEKIMVKTINDKAKTSSNKGGPIILDLKSERSKVEETHLVVFSLKWNELTTDRNGIDYAKANITLECNKSLKNKEITLNKDEIGKNIEIKLDNDFGIHEENNGSHKLIAVVKPKYCHKLCWKGMVYSNVMNHIFEREISYYCETFNPIYTQTEVRDYVSYNISDDGKLIIFTTQPNDIPTTEEKDDIINVKAIQVAHLDVGDENSTEVMGNEENLIDNEEVRNSTIEKEFIVTGKDGNNVSQFEIVDLEENSYYAVSYDYKKTQPIPYHDEQYFVIQIPDENSTKPSFLPVIVNVSLPSDDEDNSKKDDYLKPKINFYISKEFERHRILVEIEPLINESNNFLPITSSTNDTVFWLNQQSNNHSFNVPDSVMKYLCGVCKLNVIMCNTYDKSQNSRRFRRNEENVKDYGIQGTQVRYNESISNMLSGRESHLMDMAFNETTSKSYENKKNSDFTSSLTTTPSYDETDEKDDDDDNKEPSSNAKFNNLTMEEDGEVLFSEGNGKCSQLQLCYKLHIYLNSKMYDMGKECHNLTKLILTNGKNNMYSTNLMFLFYPFYIICYYYFVERGS
uniref:Cadherin domain-containing protein n=1 Tax=Strongyloides papillosus TaxID=174720 RepID=A0A0N5BCS0_STREA